MTIKTRTASPVFVAPENGATVSGDVTLNGTAEPGATVVVTLDGTAKPPLTADAAGKFAVEVGILTTGDHTLAALATDSLGKLQPEKAPWNFKGYLYNGWHRVPVTVG